jgi:hypothetical protein
MLFRYQKIMMAVANAMSNGKTVTWKDAGRKASGVVAQ